MGFQIVVDATVYKHRSYSASVMVNDKEILACKVEIVTTCNSNEVEVLAIYQGLLLALNLAVNIGCILSDAVGLVS
jgi:hypothetical protein